MKQERLLSDGSRMGKARSVKDDPKWDHVDTAWRTLQAEPEDQKVFFEHLMIAEDGGFSELGTKEDIWYSSRYFSSVLLFVFIFYNLVYILETDLTTLFGDPGDEEYLLTATLLTPILHRFNMDVGRSPQKIVAGTELVLMACLVLRTVYNVMIAVLSRGHRRWHAVARICWDQLPELSIFSAMKCLQFVTPQQFSYDLNFILWYDYAHWKLLLHFITRPLTLIIGLDCFLIKYRMSQKYISTDEINANNVMGAVILLNQVLGVVQVSKTIKTRLYRFVFGGEDGIMSEREKVRQNVWESMTAQQIFRKYPFDKAVALMLSWCDDDFQMLLLNEDPKKA
eukprot:CAMPEP_0170622388 /NCGR_PEP_ID=MMETSP0224-20130122/29104_1 /TAXON_ID=285029 /ORGANISM="Togula jolla, Strain CCCM 725" /LENGTH=338 /DNA_ID=CAMNT_0010948703 /DNA_START=68 /DNA_END=1084 /DNA_ORIENTATION=+